MKGDSKSVTFVIIVLFLITIATYSYIWQNNICIGEIGQDVDNEGNLEDCTCIYSDNISTIKTISLIIFIVGVVYIKLTYFDNNEGEQE